MKFTLPKNRTAPLVIIAIVSLLVWFILGFYHMNRMAQYSYKTKLDTYDLLNDNIASILKQDIENKYDALEVAAAMAAKTGELDKDNISGLLSLIAEGASYIDLAIVNIDGIGFNMDRKAVDYSQENIFINAKNGKINTSDRLTYSESNTPVIDFAVPIIDNNTIKGVLLAKISGQIINSAPFQNEIEEGSQIYIINADNDLVSFLQDTDINQFNYDKLISDGYLYEKENSNIPIMNLSDLYGKENPNSKSYIWARKSIGINDWSVLIGRRNVLNLITGDILRLTNIMWAAITLVIILLFIYTIIIRRNSNKRVMEMLYLDPVTGGDNWYKFRINVGKVLNSKQFGKKNYALVNFDINRFKIINDSYGYQKGDEVLKDIYQVIRRWARQGDYYTRYAADQFFIFLSYLDESDLISRINNLNDNLHQLRYTKTARIFYGVYHISERQDSIDRMGEFASIAKNNGKGNTESIISIFDDRDRGRLLEEEQIEKSMNEALNNNEFQVFLQPKYSAKDERITGAEALVRWFSSRGDMISPSYFIPVFEKNGFITELDFYMLRKVCIIIKDWLDKGLEPLPISVNISRLHFANPHVAEHIKEIVDEYDIPHNLIELELTESAFLQNKQSLIKTVIQLRSYGFLISMDDFGAGYSSLNSLKDLPLDVVKLDGELFRMTNEVERGRTVIRNTIMMAKDLHMKVVAECIETREQVEFLCTVGCDIIQGYYFAKPMPLRQFEEKYFSTVID